MIKKVRSLLKRRDQPAIHEEDNMDEGTLELDITNASENGDFYEDECKEGLKKLMDVTGLNTADLS